MSKALVLLSGGLDSMLSAKLLMEQGIEVTGLTFTSFFFGAKKARKVVDQLGIELKEVDFSKEHLEMVKNPKYGYGKNMNPCIDCHALMLRHAKKIMEDEGYDFVATGETLGQRPMSQNMDALKTVSEYSGIGDRLVRPLSAKLLEKTRPEIEGKLIRGKLLNISGRSRDRQIELVKKFGIKEYANPGGGCLLTDPEFTQRLIKILDYWPDCTGNDVELLKHGRVFWLKVKNNERVLVIVGRNEDENKMLEKFAKKGDIMVELEEIMGPMTIARLENANFNILNNLEIEIPENLKKSELNFGEEKSEDEILHIIGLLTGYYSTKARGKKVNLNIKKK